MTDTQPPKDLTAQLAQWVLVEWTRQHHERCACAGDGYYCRVPKPVALVAYEQGQTVRWSDLPGSRVKPVGPGEQEQSTVVMPGLDAKLQELRLTHEANTMCDADKPALAYVLTRNQTPIRWYATEARAEQDLELVQGGSSDSTYYELHIVPRVE